MESYRFRYAFGQGKSGVACVLAESCKQARELVEERIGTRISVVTYECLNSADTPHVIFNQFQG